MTQAIVDDTTRVEIQPTILTLFDALSNSLVLRDTIPYLPVSGLLNLAATCRDFRALLYSTPGVFRHLDLTHVKTAHFNTRDVDRSVDVWHNVQLADYLTEDDFYSGPLRGVFHTLLHRDLLRDVQTLILDGLSVTAEVCHEIVNDSTYSVRMLSIREVYNLNQAKLRQALTYACRSSRPEGSPRLKALYVFGSKDVAPPALPAATTVGANWNQKSQQALSESLQGEPDAWWSRKGRTVHNAIDSDWAQCLEACQGLIAFDAVLCRGPNHRNSSAFGQTPIKGGCNPAIATYALSGCASCGKAPEGLMDADKTPCMSLPLLAPPPAHSSSVQVATKPHAGHKPFAPRCADCLRERFCYSCNKWWCESCYQKPNESSVMVVDFEGSWSSLDGLESGMAIENLSKPRVTRSCWECGVNCNECIERTQKVCRKCCGGYCLIHNEGSSSSFCDWCAARGRGLNRL